MEETAYFLDSTVKCKTGGTGRRDASFHVNERRWPVQPL